MSLCAHGTQQLWSFLEPGHLRSMAKRMPFHCRSLDALYLAACAQLALGRHSVAVGTCCRLAEAHRDAAKGSKKGRSRQGQRNGGAQVQETQAVTAPWTAAVGGLSDQDGLEDQRAELTERRRRHLLLVFELMGRMSKADAAEEALGHLRAIPGEKFGDRRWTLDLQRKARLVVLQARLQGGADSARVTAAYLDWALGTPTAVGSDEVWGQEVRGCLASHQSLLPEDWVVPLLPPAPPEVGLEALVGVQQTAVCYLAALGDQPSCAEYLRITDKVGVKIRPVAPLGDGADAPTKP